MLMLNGLNKPHRTEEMLRQCRILTEIMPQIVWTARADGELDYVNSKWFEYTGVKFENLAGRGMLSVVHDDDQEAVTLQWKDCLASGRPFEGELRLRRNDGVYRWHLMRALAMRDGNGTVVQWCGTCTDINDQKTHIEDLEKRIIEDPAKLAHGLAPASKTIFAERYLIEGVLSTGGMGNIYRAKHIHMGRVVAIKILHSFLHGNLKLTKQFQQEAEAASGLIHPNIVTVFDFGISKTGQPFLVMDYIEGKSLEDLLNEQGHIETLRCLRLFIRICDGLQEAHSKGVVHCDIKPGNIVIGRKDGRECPKIVDFGIARINPRDLSQAEKQTMDFSVVGSPRYMSPEQCIGALIDERSDIYSLACVMYECLTGRPVFDDLTVYEIFNKHVNYPPKPFSKVRPDLKLSPALEKLLFKMLEKAADKRVQTVSEVRRRLMTIYRQLAAPS